MASEAALGETGTTAYVSINDRPKMWCELTVDVPDAVTGVAGTISYRTPGDATSKPKTLKLPDMSDDLAVAGSMSVLVPGANEYALTVSARSGSGDIRLKIQQAISGTA
jgi:hypothetical protein